MNPLYGYFAAAVLAAMALSGAVGYFKGTHDASAQAKLVMSELAVANQKAELDRAEQVRALEQSLALSQSGVAEAYERGKKDAKNAGETVTSELRAGNIRLRKQWADCETRRLSDATASASELDAAIRDREESAGRIVRAAAECDAQVRGLQELLLTARKHMNKQ